MLGLRIEGDNNSEGMKEIIFSNFTDGEIEIDKEEYDDDRFTLVVNSKYPMDSFYTLMADAIQKIITNYYIDRIILKRIDRIYEGEIVVSEESTLDEIKDELWNSDSYNGEKTRIKNEIEDYIENNDTLVLEGYIRFRLYDYLYLLDIAIDKVITKLEEEEKVEEFFDRIQSFVEMQTPLVPYLNLILGKDDFVFKDIDSNEIGDEILEQVGERFKGLDVSKIDILISSLIMMAPNRIIIHTERGFNHGVIATISKIFGDKVVICTGCNICNFNR